MAYGSIENIRDLIEKTEKEISPMLTEADQIKLKKLLEDIRTEANYCTDINNILPPIKEENSVKMLKMLYGRTVLNPTEYTDLMSHIETLSTDAPERKANLSELAAFWTHFVTHNKDLSVWVYKDSPRARDVQNMILKALVSKRP